MKILILANYDVGLYQFRKELIEELKKEHEVALSFPFGELTGALKETGCELIQTPVDRRGMNPKTDFKLFLQYLSIIRAARPDLVITYTVKPNIYGGLACRISHAPYAANVTGLGTSFQKKGALRILVKALYRAGLKKAAPVFFENSENCRIFTDEHVIQKKQAHVLNGAGVCIERYPFEEYPKNGERTRFLFMARVMREKGIDELLAAMQRLRAEGAPCCLDVLGICEEDYESLLRQKEKEGWLRYYGYQKDVRPFIARAHCFVLPSWHEGMANTNLECASSGRPVITSDIPGCREAVIDGVTGYLCKRRDEGSLHAAMKKFAGLGYEARRAMGVAGRKHMESEFDKKKVVAETIKALFQDCGRQKGIRRNV